MSLRANISKRKIEGAGLPLSSVAVKGAEHISAGTTSVMSNAERLEQMMKNIDKALALAEKSSGEKDFTARLVAEAKGNKTNS